MTKPFDSTLKQLFDESASDSVAWLCAASGLPVPASATPVDSDVSTISLTADKVYRLSYPPGGFLHLEIQSSRDPFLSQRIHEYNCLIHSRHNETVRSCVLLLRRDAAPAVSGEYICSDEAGRYLWFRFYVIRLWEQPLANLINGPLATLPLAVLTDEGAASVPHVLALIRDRFNAHHVPPSTQDTLWSASFILCGLRFDLPDIELWFEGVQGMEESTTYQAILRKGETRGQKIGEEIGQKIGEEIGQKIGEEIGELRARRADLIDAIGGKFGSVPPALEQRILAENDPDILRAALLSLFRIDSIADFHLGSTT